MLGALLPFAVLAGAAAAPQESFKQVLDQIDGTVGKYNAELGALAPAPASPSSLLEQSPKADAVAKDDWKKVKVVDPTSWVGAAGFPKDPEQRGFYTDLDKELGIYKQMKQMWQDKSKDYQSDIDNFAKETKDNEADTKKIEESLREHPFYVRPQSFIELSAEASEQPPDLQTVEKRLAALRDKMEGDATRIDREASLIDSPSLLQRSDATSSATEAAHAATPATSFLEEEPDSDSTPRVSTTPSPADIAMRKMLYDKMAQVKVNQPTNWIEAAGFPHDPTQRAVYANLDKEMAIYNKMKMKWRKNLKRVFAEIHSYKGDAKKELEILPTRGGPTSLLQTSDATSDAQERYDNAQQLLRSLSSFLQENGFDDSEYTGNDFQDELSREDLKRSKRKQDDITSGKKFTRKDEEGWLAKMKATQAVLQEEAKNYGKMGAVAKYMSEDHKKPVKSFRMSSKEGDLSSSLLERSQSTVKDGETAAARSRNTDKDGDRRSAASKEYPMPLQSFEQEEKATEHNLQAVETKFLNQAKYLKAQSMKMLDSSRQHGFSPASLLQTDPDAIAGAIDDSAAVDLQDTLPDADGLKKAEDDAEALTAKIKKSNDAFKRSLKDEDISDQLSSPSSLLQISDFGDTLDSSDNSLDSLNSDSLSNDFTPSSGSLESPSRVPGVPLFDDVKLGTQFGALDDDPYKIPTVSDATTLEPSSTLDSFNSLADDSPTSFTSPDTLDPALSDDAGLGSMGFKPGPVLNADDDSASMPSFSGSSDTLDSDSSDFKPESFLKTDSTPYTPSFADSPMSYPGDYGDSSSTSMDPVSWIETKSKATVGSNHTDDHSESNLRKAAEH